MIQLVQARLDAVIDIAKRHHVRSLAIFGSATRSDFRAAGSDIDLLVEFLPLSPAEYAKAYFGLQEELEVLLGVPVDLVERIPIRNHVFRKAIESSKTVLYEAA